MYKVGDEQAVCVCFLRSHTDGGATLWVFGLVVYSHVDGRLRVIAAGSVVDTDKAGSRGRFHVLVLNEAIGWVFLVEEIKRLEEIGGVVGVNESVLRQSPVEEGQAADQSKRSRAVVHGCFSDGILETVAVLQKCDIHNAISKRD